MATKYNIFYNTDKEIVWCSTAPVTSTIITEQAAAGLSHANLDAIDDDTTPVPNKYYVNSDGTAIVAKTRFDPTFSTQTPAVDAVVNVTGLPAGTEVWLDNVSKGNMSDTTLTFTAKEGGKFFIKFTKDKYVTYTSQITVQRYVTS